MVKPSEFVAIDLETTGKSPRNASIIEVGAVRFENGTEQDQYVSLTRTSRPVSSEITEITGITAEEVASAPKRDRVMQELAAFCSDLPLVVHNAPFDMAFLVYADRSWQARRVFDTLEIARAAYPDLTSHRLGDLAERFEVECSRSHRALPDARVTAAVFCHLCAEAPSAVVESSAARDIDPDDRRPPHIVTLDLFRAGVTVDDIIQQRGLAESTIEGHFEKLIVDGKIQLGDLLAESAIRAATNAWRAVGFDASLTEAKEVDEGLSWRALRWTRAASGKAPGRTKRKK